MSWRWRVVATATALLLLYGGAVGLLAYYQRLLIYPAPVRPEPAAPGFEAVSYRTADGLTLHALYRPAMPGKPTIVFFHGNGDSLSSSIVSTEAYAAAGYGLLLHEYRGYAGNPGKPTEAGLYADGRAALGWLSTQGVPPERLVLMGFSLGTGVATKLAGEVQPAALVLIAPYTSLPEAVSARFRGLVPAHLLVRDHFDSAATIRGVHAPILIMHDRDDASIPFGQGQRLAELAPQARLILFSGHGHQLGYSSDAQRAGLAWLDAQPSHRQIPAGT